MFKNIFKGKEIEKKAELIAAEIMKHYPVEKDNTNNDEQNSKNKVDKDLTIAITKGKALIIEISKEMNLKFYGKAKLCKRTQSKLLVLGYSMNTAVFIVKNLVVALTAK